ncbi:MAG: hypothetical protein US52_C0063G0005 [candidate division WS6 bacterium GW2011_GWA2_37_6]|uniref:Uncharacterized protein n=1 Tax=candidate division WS6 bacterium GW2011_GWA2_37_6 TaxID=1619087 RepID=A0A0G0K0Y9_9BACT|nr:MAG: hypothetical protein US52_C0063G0005 [candidate division WS6 bacterium GW2011_GWA2_37_6]
MAMSDPQCEAAILEDKFTRRTLLISMAVAAPLGCLTCSTFGLLAYEVDQALSLQELHNALEKVDNELSQYNLRVLNGINFSTDYDNYSFRADEIDTNDLTGARELLIIKRLILQEGKKYPKPSPYGINLTFISVGDHREPHINEENGPYTLGSTLLWTDNQSNFAFETGLLFNPFMRELKGYSMQQNQDYFGPDFIQTFHHEMFHGILGTIKHVMGEEFVNQYISEFMSIEGGNEDIDAVIENMAEFFARFMAEPTLIDQYTDTDMHKLHIIKNLFGQVIPEKYFDDLQSGKARNYDEWSETNANLLTYGN